jgi:exodeoxyribonuclease VII large subunit
MLVARGPGPRLQRAREEFSGRVGTLEALSPLGVLARGYSITFRGDNGQVVRDSAEVNLGDELTTRLHRGRLRSQVIATEHVEEESDGA